MGQGIASAGNRFLCHFICSHSDLSRECRCTRRGLRNGSVGADELGGNCGDHFSLANLAALGVPPDFSDFCVHDLRQYGAASGGDKDRVCLYRVDDIELTSFTRVTCHGIAYS